MNLTVTNKEFKQLIVWSEKFEQFKRMKDIARKVSFYNSLIPEDVTDKRMNFATKCLKKVEPVATFENGVLTNKAAYLLNAIKLHKAGCGTIKIKN